MQNSPIHQLTSENVETVTSASLGRLIIVGGALVSVMCLILGRVIWLQNSAAAEFQGAFEQTRIEYETIPARDGRIRTESEVLATDVDQYRLAMHYRWLEEPANPDWLRRQIRRQTSADDSSNDDLRQAAIARFESQRREQWEHLARLADVSQEDLNSTRQQIQSRVEQIADSVNRRHSAITSTSAPADTVPTSRSDKSISASIVEWIGSVRRELTTTPRRSIRERIIVREEEDFHTILNEVPLEVAAAIREQPTRFPGVEVVVSTQRAYPKKSRAAHAVGTRTAARESERMQGDLLELSNDTSPQRLGRSGVELTWNHRLRGIPGRRRIVRNRRQEIVEIVDERKPVSGKDILLTLHPDLQRVAESLLAEALGDIPRQRLQTEESGDDGVTEPSVEPVGGCILVMDIQNGRLLAAASGPTFDLNLYQGGSNEEWQRVRMDQRKPLFSRITGMALAPGSVFKTLSAVAMLESEAAHHHESFRCQGFLHNPDQHRCLIFRRYGAGHGTVSLTSALSQSCNVFFFAAAERMGPEPLVAWSQRFGFGQRTAVDLPFESRGQLTRPHDTPDPLGYAIGQDGLTTTPLQIVRLMAAVANDGWLVTPHIVSQDGIAQSADEADDRPRQITRRRIPGLSPGTLAAVRRGLRDVVAERSGTAYRTVRLEEVSIAGKTGTAQSGTTAADHAWFSGFTPAESPQFAFVVVLESGGSGSKAAGPIARELVRSMLELNLLKNLGAATPHAAKPPLSNPKIVRAFQSLR